MPQLNLVALKCVITEDILGADECEIKLYADGSLVRRIAGVLGQNEVLSLANESWWFSTAIAVKLYDIDNPPIGDAHDNLGVVSISSAINPNGIGLFTGNGAQYELSYKVIPGQSPSQSTGSTFLTVTSETGIPHAACLFKVPNGSEKWFGFKPQIALSPLGPGFVDTASRQMFVNHAITFEVPLSSVALCEQMISTKYANATYVLGVLDCVSLAADVARLCELRVANANFTPFGLITYLREYNTFTSFA